MTELEMLTHRLHQVEVVYRRFRRGAVLAALMFGAVLFGAAAQSRPIIQGTPQVTGTGAPARPAVEEVIRARQFVLVDGAGKERASLVADGAGSVFLVMFDPNGRPRADMSVTPYGPSINFHDPNGKPRTIIGSTTLVSSHVASEDGVVERNTPSSIVLFDGTGKLLWRTP